MYGSLPESPEVFKTVLLLLVLELNQHQDCQEFFESILFRSMKKIMMHLSCLPTSTQIWERPGPQRHTNLCVARRTRPSKLVFVTMSRDALNMTTVLDHHELGDFDL